MNIDTSAIRHLRDNLLADKGLAVPETHDTGADATELLDTAVVRRVEPFAETMYLVMMADGDLAEVEKQALAGAVNVLTDGQIDTGQMDALLQRFESKAVQSGSEARLMQIGAQICGDPDDREMAFTLAAVIALADDQVDVRENRMLEIVQEYFGISNKRMTVLLESLN